MKEEQEQILQMLARHESRFGQKHVVQTSKQSTSGSCKLAGELTLGVLGVGGACPPECGLPPTEIVLCTDCVISNNTQFDMHCPVVCSRTTLVAHVGLPILPPSLLCFLQVSCSVSSGDLDLRAPGAWHIAHFTHRGPRHGDEDSVHFRPPLVSEFSGLFWSVFRPSPTAVMISGFSH